MKQMIFKLLLVLMGCTATLQATASDLKETNLMRLYLKSRTETSKGVSYISGFDSGGGKILLCPNLGNKKVITPMLLDIYEGIQSGYQIDLGPGQSLEEKIKYVLNRLSKVAPFRAKIYEKWISELIISQSELAEYSTLPFHDYIGRMTVIPKNCEVLQATLQRENLFVNSGFKRHVFVKEIFDNLSQDLIVQLYFHEIILRDARLRGSVDSVLVRHLNYFILSKQIENISTAEFNEKLRKLGSKCEEIENLANRKKCGEFDEAIYANNNISWFGFRFNGLSTVDVSYGVPFYSLNFFAINPEMDLTPLLKVGSSILPFTLTINDKSNTPIKFNLEYVDKPSYSFTVEKNDFVPYIKMEITRSSVTLSNAKETLIGDCSIDFKRYSNELKTINDHYLICAKLRLVNNETKVARYYEPTKGTQCGVELDKQKNYDVVISNKEKCQLVR